MIVLDHGIMLLQGSSEHNGIALASYGMSKKKKKNLHKK